MLVFWLVFSVNSITGSVVVAAMNPPVKKTEVKSDDDSKTISVVDSSYKPVKITTVKKNNDLFVIKLLIFVNVFLLGITAVIASTLLRRRKSL